MRKVLIAVVLIALILGVSYIKTIREEQKRAGAVQNATRDAAQEIINLENAVDSVRSVEQQTEAALTDSIRILEEAHAAQADSLNSFLAARDETVMNLSDSVITPEESVPKGTAREESAQTDTISLHHKILTYYKKRYDDLPTDLSSYETRVALSEIRQETAHRFSISLDRLNEIRESRKLDY